MEQVKKPLWRRILRFIGLVLGVILLLALLLILYLTVTEYRPEAVEALERPADAGSRLLVAGESVRLLSFNTGYAALGESEDFFMDGGEGVRPDDAAEISTNAAGIAAVLAQNPADLYLLQEVDADSKRSYGMDQRSYYSECLGLPYEFALNFRCSYVPFPLPTIGKVNSGLLTLTDCAVQAAERRSLPSPFRWPVSAANLKRCLLVSYLDLEGSDAQLVVVNLHLEAYDDGEGKAAQTEMLMEFLTAEYEQGNYVIAGGDFNQMFPGSLDLWPLREDAYWAPGVLETVSLPSGWQYACDATTATCRLLDSAYDPERTQRYVIDGYILSPNVTLTQVETLDAGFVYSDHNPVLLTVTLEKD